MKECQSEWDRLSEVNNKRKNTHCYYEDGISYDEFVSIANKVGNKIKRVKEVNVNDLIIYCSVESQTGYSNWDFNVDFNDWGHITGTYWIQTDNDDSLIPSHYGQMVSEAIYDLMGNRGINLPHLSDYVDNNKELETSSGLNYKVKNSLLKKIFRKSIRNVLIGFDSKNLIGEHLYPVISILKYQGFKNIKSIPIKDIDNKSQKYRFQVEQVVIGGTGYFEDNDVFREDVEVIITYHEKREIILPYSEQNYKGKNYIYVEDQLKELGFSQIYECKIKDLITGWIVKDGSVEKVVIGEQEEVIRQNHSYLYDLKIVVYYHTKR